MPGMLPLAAGLVPGSELLDPHPANTRLNTAATTTIASFQAKAFGL